MRTLGHVVKIKNHFAFYLVFLMKKLGHMMALHSHSKHKTKMKIKCCVLMAHHSQSKHETKMKIECFVLKCHFYFILFTLFRFLFFDLLSKFYFTLILILFYFSYISI